METQIVETNQLIAQRVPPGDNWVLVKRYNLYGDPV